jgi:hypothetical protein
MAMAVGIVINLRAGWSGVRFPVGAENFPVPGFPGLFCGPQSTGVFSWQGVKRPGRENNHTLPSGTEGKNEWSHASTPAVSLLTVSVEVKFGIAEM